MSLFEAQGRTNCGTVKSAADGQVIIGANVTVVGTTQGTSTGVDGSYSIKARVGSQLSFSYLGMKTQTITVGNTTTLDITLEKVSMMMMGGAAGASALMGQVATAVAGKPGLSVNGTTLTVEIATLAQQRGITLGGTLQTLAVADRALTLDFE